MLENKLEEKWIEEELSIHEFAERFLGVTDLTTPCEYDTKGFDIKILTLDKDGNEVYKNIDRFVVKDPVDTYYTDGILNGTSEHSIIEDGKEVKLKDHQDFTKVEKKMLVTDFEIEGEHTYLANGRLNKNTTSGGKAIAFHSSVRLRLTPAGQLKGKVNNIDQTIGIHTKVQVIKNRCGPPLRKAEFDLFFDRGIDDEGSWLDALKDFKIITNSGASYTWIDPETQEEVKFMAKNWKKLLNERPDMKEKCYKQICDCYIMKYNTDNLSPEDIEISDEAFPE